MFIYNTFVLVYARDYVIKGYNSKENVFLLSFRQGKALIVPEILRSRLSLWAIVARNRILIEYPCYIKIVYPV